MAHAGAHGGPLHPNELRAFEDAKTRGSNAPTSSLHGEDLSASELLADRIAALSPQVRPKEAQQLADCAYPHFSATGAGLSG